MIQANELRLGNYFFIGGLDRYVKVSSVFLSHFKCTDENGIDFNNHQNNIKPIELTEEILLKCGFKKENLKPSNRHSEYFSIWIEDYKYSFSFAYFRNNWGFYHSYTDALKEEDNNRFDAISFGIKYLHQLQNLYFALSNEELKINL